MKTILLVVTALSLAAIACATLITSLTPTAIPPTATPTVTATPEPTYTPTPTSPPTPTSTPLPTHTPTSEPSPTAIPGWSKFEGGGIQIWLPESYTGGNPGEDIDLLVESLNALGPKYRDMAKLIEKNPSAYVIWAFDSQVGDSPYLTNMAVGSQKLP